MASIYFKYMTYGRLENLLDTWKLRFSQPSALNDPFEMPAFHKAMNWTDNLLQNTAISANVLAESARSASSPQLAHALKSSGATIAASRDKKWPFTPFYFLWQPQTPVPDDDSESKAAIKEAARKVDQEFGVLSLTSTRTNLLMWAHYADEHRGAVIAIDVDDPAFRYPKERRQRVNYLSFRPRIAANEEVLLEHFFYKSDDWRYEEEYRIVRRFDLSSEKAMKEDSHGRAVHLFPLPQSALKGIILGANVHTDQVKSIWHRVQAVSPDTIVEHAIVDERHFGIGFVQYRD